MRFPFHRWKNWHGMKGSVTSHTTLSSSSRIWAQFCAWPHPCGLRKMREGISLLTHLPSLSKGGLKRLPLTMLCRKLKGAETGALIPPWPHELYTWEATPPCSWLLIRRLYLEGRSGSGPCCHSIRAHPSQWGRSAGPPATRGLLLLCSVWAPRSQVRSPTHRPNRWAPESPETMAHSTPSKSSNRRLLRWMSSRSPSAPASWFSEMWADSALSTALAWPRTWRDPGQDPDLPTGSFHGCFPAQLGLTHCAFTMLHAAETVGKRQSWVIIQCQGLCWALFTCFTNRWCLQMKKQNLVPSEGGARSQDGSRGQLVSPRLWRQLLRTGLPPGPGHASAASLLSEVISASLLPSLPSFLSLFLFLFHSLFLLSTSLSSFLSSSLPLPPILFFNALSWPFYRLLDVRACIYRRLCPALLVGNCVLIPLFS